MDRLKIKSRSVSFIVNIVRYAFFISFGFVLIYPFLFIIVNSVKSFTDTYDPMVTWVPKHFNIENIKLAFKVFDVGTSLKNTIYYEIVSALIQFCSCSIAAYGLARFKFKGKNLLLGIMIINILVPTMMIITPSYVNYSHMDFMGILSFVSKIVGHNVRPNIVDTPFAMYLPSLFGVGLKGGLFIYIFYQFFKGLPKELEEAAWIDGAGPFKTFLRIVLPSAESAIITVLLFSIVWHWNDYYLAQMYLSNKPTFSVLLNNFGDSTLTTVLGSGATESQLLSVPVLLSGCLLYILPLFLFYILIQKKFIASVATSGIVG